MQVAYSLDMMDVWNVLQHCTEWAGWLMSDTVAYVDGLIEDH
jgi:hypothetical protein